MNSVNIVGLSVNIGTMAAAIARVIELARAAAPAYVCVANVDMLTRARRSADFRRVFDDAALKVTDGMPLVWLARRQTAETVERVYGPDFTLEICREAARLGLPIFVYGGTEQEVQGFRANILRRIPDLDIAGQISPKQLPLNPPLDIDAVQQIRDSRARIVIVCLGCPKQENWAARHSPHLDSTLVCVGMALAQIAGLVPRAPSWIRNSGLEWLWRLLHEPRRLWKRYILGNTLFIGYVLQGALMKRRHQRPQ